MVVEIEADQMERQTRHHGTKSAEENTVAAGYRWEPETASVCLCSLLSHDTLLPVGCSYLRDAMLSCVCAARNAIIVLVTAGLAAILYHEDIDYFTLTNTTQSGLPPFKVPDFHIVDGNTTYGPDYIFKVCECAQSGAACPFACSLPELSVPATTESHCVSLQKIGTGFAIIPLLGIVETIAIGKAFGEFAGRF